MKNERLAQLGLWAHLQAVDVILPWWTSEYIVDREKGGFYGRVTIDMQRMNDEPRGLTLTGRMLYAFSVAYRIFHGQIYLDRAEYTFRELIDRFYDKTYGGAFTTVSADGEVLSFEKPNYCEAFFIMGCAEYYRATGDEEALRVAMETFRIMEEKVRIAPGVYQNNVSRDWQPAKGIGFGRAKDGKAQDLPENVNMFPHHLTQAYLRLFEATRDKTVEDALSGLVEYAVSRLHDRENHCFMTLVTKDGRRFGSNQSYGHDCEISYLLVNCADALGDSTIKKSVRNTVTDVLENVLENDFDQWGSLYNSGDLSGGGRSPVHVWWAQAEAVSAMLCGYDITGDERFLTACERQAGVIEKWFVNRDNGDWYNNILLDEIGGQISDGMHGFDKLNFGKCPFHNTQMCFEVMSRVSKMMKEDEV